MELLIAKHEQMIQYDMLQKIKGHLADGRSVYFIVPEQFTLHSEMDILKQLETRSLIDIKVSSFSSLAREILGKVGGKREHLNELGRYLMIYRLIEEHKDSLKILNQLTKNQGIVSSIAETLAELRSMGITGDELSKLYQADDILGKKISDISLILTQYENLLGDQIIDTEGRLIALSYALKEAIWLEGVHFYFSSFQQFSNLELSILQELEKVGAIVHIGLVLPTEQITHYTKSDVVIGHEVYDVNWKFFQKLKRIFKVNLKISVANHESVINDEFKLFASKALQWRGTGDEHVFENISFQESPNILTEIVVIAQLIRRKLIEEGGSFSDFNIVVTQTSDYYRLIRRIFRDHSITFFIDEKKKMIDNHLTRAFLAICQMIESNMQSEYVIAYLKSGLIDIETDEILAFERHITSRKLKGDMIFSPKYYRVDEKRYHNSIHKLEIAKRDCKKSWHVAEKIYSQVSNLLKDTKGEATATLYASSIYHFLSQPEVKRGYDSLSEDLIENGYYDQIAENKQIIEKLVEILEQIVASLGERTISFHEFIIFLRKGIEETEIGLMPPTTDYVFIGALNRTRLRRSKYQIILGLTDLWFPGYLSSNTVFLEEEKEILSRDGITMYSSGQHVIDAQNISFFQMLTQPYEKLILSWPLSSHLGEVMNRAIMINQFIEKMPNIKINSGFQTMLHLKKYSKTRALSWCFEKIRCYLMANGKASFTENQLKELGSYYHYFLKENKKVFQVAIREIQGKKQPELLKSDIVPELFTSIRKKKTSISELETYRKCPYKHYIEYGLKPFKEEKENFESMEIGTFLHYVLSKITSEYGQALLNDNDIEMQVEKIILSDSKNIFGDLRLEDSKNKAMLNKIKNSAIFASKHVMRQIKQGDFLITNTEVAFGKDKELPPIHLKNNAGEILLEGTIDRIDTSQHFLRIIDYKTGGKEFQLSRVLDGLDLQLILYLLVAMEHFRNKHAAGAFYLRLSETFISENSQVLSDINEAFIKKILMDGLILANEESISAMDYGVKENFPQVLKFKGANRRKIIDKDNVVNAKQLNQILCRVKDVATQISEDLLIGKIDILPAKFKDKLVCDFCNYRGICKYEDDDQYREILDIKWDQFKVEE